ncbi:MAG TPA: hypothetical protein VK614_03220 [Allosphingosinicella sp.]|nr:hypothetical protein [Allosphingosinicella sp.]
MSRKIVHQLTSGMAGWLTYEQMRLGVDNLTEGTLYKPIEDLAKGRGFQVRHEFPLPKKTATRGAPQEVDFVIVDRTGEVVVAIEVKYKRRGKKLTGSISKDAIKLRDLTIEQIEAQIATGSVPQLKGSVQGFNLTKAIIVVWRSGDLVGHLLDREQKPIVRQFRELVRAMLPDGVEFAAKNLAACFLKGAASKPVGSRFGSLRSGSTITNQRFWVASFLEIPSWKELAAIEAPKKAAAVAGKRPNSRSRHRSAA